jgi:hypothetical protein
MNHKHEAPMAIEKMYIIYLMHIDFIQFPFHLTMGQV